MSGQKIRVASLDVTRNPPMQYIVAKGCPKLLEGHRFYACACYGPAVASQDKPSIQVACEYLAAHDFADGRSILCNHGGEKVSGGGVQFGIPIVRHAAQQEDDGSHPD